MFQVQGQAGYNNLITELNKICAIYIHPTYATAARVVGYSDYNTDVNNLTKIGALSISGTYWLGARYTEKDDRNRTFYYGRSVVNGWVSSSWIYYTSSSGNVYTDMPSFGVRPVVTLKPSAPLSKGTGTSGDYYQLK